jgi:hypothetical protein
MQKLPRRLLKKLAQPQNSRSSLATLVANQIPPYCRAVFLWFNNSMERSPFYKPPEHITEQQAEMFLMAARALMPEREPSILSFEDVDLPEDLVLYSFSRYVVNGSMVTITETEFESEDDCCLEVKISTSLGTAGIEEKHYEFYPVTGFSMYRFNFKPANRHLQYEGLTEEESEALSEKNRKIRQQFMVQEVLSGIHDFTSERLYEVLAVLSECSGSNRIQ